MKVDVVEDRMNAVGFIAVPGYASLFWIFLFRTSDTLMESYRLKTSGARTQP